MEHLTHYTPVPQENLDRQLSKRPDLPEQFLQWGKDATNKKAFGSPFNPSSLNGTPLFSDIRDQDYTLLADIETAGEEFMKSHEKTEPKAPPKPRQARRRRSNDSLEDEEEDDEVLDDSYLFDDETDGLAVDYNPGQDKVTTTAIRINTNRTMLEIVMPGFGLPRAHFVKIPKHIYVRAEDLPMVPACVDLLTQFNGEYPTDVCLLWLSLGRSGPEPEMVPAEDLVESGYPHPMESVPEYLLQQDWDGDIIRRQGLDHDCYRKFPFQFPVMGG
ncbi:hypothetical protein R1sor_022023 [Riccia sorocarpa]|uniref:TAFII55 protein conserved region domain-containing protein n=1 Tax=Riccia sorocarpa TaxID=122646 RepID=A0ABD3GIM9_9MARC